MPSDVPPWVFAIAAPVWICDLEGRFVFVNDAARKFLDLAATGDIATPCYKAVAGSDVSGERFCRPDCEVRDRARRGMPLEPLTIWRRSVAKERTPVTVLSLSVLLPERPDPVLVHIAVASAYSGRVRRYISRVASRSALPASRPVAPLSGTLTKRELDILRLLARDLTLNDVAERLGISYHTVRTHIRNLLPKLGAHSTMEAIAMFLTHVGPEISGS